MTTRCRPAALMLLAGGMILAAALPLRAADLTNPQRPFYEITERGTNSTGNVQYGQEVDFYGGKDILNRTSPTTSFDNFPPPLLRQTNALTKTTAVTFGVRGSKNKPAVGINNPWELYVCVGGSGANINRWTWLNESGYPTEKIPAASGAVELARRSIYWTFHNATDQPFDISGLTFRVQAVQTGGNPVFGPSIQDLATLQAEPDSYQNGASPLAAEVGDYGRGDYLPPGGFVRYFVHSRYTSGDPADLSPGIIVQADGVLISPGVTQVVTFTHRTIIPNLFIGPVTISGQATLDLNKNGNADAGEPPLAGMLIILKDGSDFRNQILGSAITDSTGQFWFTDLPPNVYVLNAVPPSGLVTANAHQGVNGTRLDASSLVATPAEGFSLCPGYQFLARFPP